MDIAIMEPTGTGRGSKRRAQRRTPARIRLAADLDVTAAAALLQQLQPLLKARRQVVIRGDAVERASTAAIQLLLAADAALVARDGRLVLADPSPVLCEALTDLGLEAELQRWRAQP